MRLRFDSTVDHTVSEANVFTVLFVCAKGLAVKMVFVRFLGERTIFGRGRCSCLRYYAKIKMIAVKNVKNFA